MSIAVIPIKEPPAPPPVIRFKALSKDDPACRAALEDLTKGFTDLSIDELQLLQPRCFHDLRRGEWAVLQDVFCPKYGVLTSLQV